MPVACCIVTRIRMMLKYTTGVLMQLVTLRVS